jgi:hypothetical protein
MTKFRNLLLVTALFITTAVGAQTFHSAQELITPVTQKKPAATYVVAYGKVLAKKTSAGLTKFNYIDGKVSREILPNGTVGTYLYDRNGRFESIAYNDGRTVHLQHSPTGQVIGLQSSDSKVVRIRKKLTIAELDKQALAPFLTLQEGLSKLDPSATNVDPVCVEDSDAPCIVSASGSGGGGGGGGPGGIFGNGSGSGATGGGDPGAGGPGGGGITIYPNTGTVYPTAEECKAKVCEGGKLDMDAYCALVAKGPDNLRRCHAKNMEYYANCLRSCSTGDWSWTESFNFIS